jgi:Mg-chelatase subunit ChlD
VAVDSSENVYALTLDGLVWKLDRSGSVVAGWDVSAFSAGDSLVVDLAVDDDERVYTVDQAAQTVRVWAPDPEVVPEPPTRRGGACAVRGDKRAAPETVRLGDEVTVRLSVGGRCPQSAPRADIVLVIDQSYSMVANGGITATIEAAREFIGRIDFGRDRVGVVAFNNTAQLLSPLTSNAAEALAALDRIEPIGGTEIALAIRAATNELHGPNARADVQPAIVLLTDGKDRESEAVLAEAADARALGTRVFTIGFGDIDPMVMVLAASSPEDYYFAPDAGALLAIYTEIASRISASVLVKSLVLVDELPADMAYRGPVEGPAPVVVGARLTWNLNNVPLQGITVSYRLAPQMLGLRPTNVRADAEFVDGLDAAGSLRFPVPRVQVISEAPTPTPTRTPFPTPTRPPRPTTLFLPIALWQRCHASTVHADVALVMDTSNSMLEPGQEGGNKLEAAVGAARIFLEQLEMPDDRAALIAFNTEASVAAPLTGDRAVLLAALESLETGAGTRIDRGLSGALAELTREPPSAERNRVVVMLTDGRTVDVSNDEILATAQSLKSVGILVFTVGLGVDVDHVLLTGVASRPEWYFRATDAAALAGIYRQIAYELPCANIDWP